MEERRTISGLSYQKFSDYLICDLVHQLNAIQDILPLQYFHRNVFCIGS